MSKKNRTLSDEEKQSIAEHAINNPKESDREIALRFGCNPAQVRYARNLAEAGKLSVHRWKLTEEARTNITAATRDANELCAELLRNLLAELVHEDIPPQKKIVLFGTLTRAKRTLQESALEAHLKTPDAQILARIIRRFLPTATDEECVMIINEEIANWKHSL